MNIAYLITAYIDPSQLRRLCDAILFNQGEDKSEVFLHIDKKVDATPFQKELGSYSNVHFCPNRYFINWGGFNQVLSQRELLRCALESSVPFDRFVCISATDYPLWPNQQIISFYKNNPSVELVGGYDLTESRSMWQKHKVVYYHFFRDLPVHPSLRRLFSYGSRTLLRLMGIKREATVPLEDGKLGHIYTGSDYWSISRECAQLVYDNLKDNSPYVKRLRNTYIPSELVVNTIVYNSEYGKNAIPRLIIDEENQYPMPGLDLLTPLQVIDYNGAIKVWEIEDFNYLSNSGKMFCRKVISGVSDSLIAKIDSVLRLEEKN